MLKGGETSECRQECLGIVSNPVLLSDSLRVRRTLGEWIAVAGQK